MNNQGTPFIDTSSFSSESETADVDVKGKTNVKASNPQDSNFYTATVRDAPVLLEYLEKNFSFSAILFALIGYVVIASFGQLNTIGKYAGYILFLISLFIFYKFSRIESKNSFKKYLIIGLFVALLGLSIYGNLGFLKKVYNLTGSYFIGQNPSKNVQPPVATSTQQ